MKNDFLRDVKPEEVFHFNSGVIVRNIYELAREIEIIDDYTFKYYCHLNHDDFASWIGGVIGDIELAERLRKIKTREKYLGEIYHRIKKIEHRSIIAYFENHFAQSINDFLNRNYRYITVIILLFICTSFVLVLSLNYASIHNFENLKNQVMLMEDRNMCLNAYAFSGIVNTQSKPPTLESTCLINYTIKPNIDNALEDTPSMINLDSLIVDDKKAILMIDNLSVAVFANTSSMLPIINHNTKALEIKPEEKDLNIGDIISYWLGNEIIVHRIIDIGHDDSGTYYITKGDNNPSSDKIKIRYENIEGKIIVLIY